jgi:ubiquinone/menaquinone biosynthesis C-methylase UbiE
VRICLSCGSALTGDGWRCASCGADPESHLYPRFTDDLPELACWDAGEVLEAAAAEAMSFWAKQRNKLLVWMTGTFFPGASSFFEAGCGTGIVLEAIADAMPQLRLVGADPYEPALDAARRRAPTAELIQADVRRLPFDSEFDVVAALDVLEHVDDDAAGLRELRRALRPGGGAMFAVPQHPWLWSAADEWALHHRRYTRSELLGKVEAAGFELIRATSFVTLLLPAVALARLLQRNSSRYDPLAELRLPRTLQTVLSEVLSAEAAVIRRGFDLPAGSSLLVIGRRPYH